MIKILKASELEESFFEGRDFGESIEVVKDVLRDVKNLGDKALSDYPGLEAGKTSKGLEGTSPIGKWSTATGSYWHWVVEELQPGLVLMVR